MSNAVVVGGVRRRLVVGVTGLSVLAATTGIVMSAATAAAMPAINFVVVPNGGAGVGINTKTDTLYVSGNGRVSVIDGATNKITATIPESGKQPGYIAVNTTTRAVYVANVGSNTVTVINGKTNKVTHTIKVGHDPASIAINATRNLVYVANTASNTVSVINGRSNKVTHTIKVRHHPNSVAVNPRSDTVYASFEGVQSVNTYWYHAGVAVISGKKNKVTRLVEPAGEAGSSAFGVAVDPKSARVYVVFDYAYGAVVVLNGKNDKVINTISVGSYPNMIALNPAKHLMYVGWSNANQQGIKVSIVNTRSGTILGNFGDEQGQTGMALDPATNKTYISSNDLYLGGEYTTGLEVLRGT
jgi:YVTN family beta-propeller protein